MTDAHRTEEECFIEALTHDLAEQERVTKLTNEQLVEEILNELPFTHMDALIEEACTRLDPDWSTREKPPLAPHDEEMLKRVHEKGMARIKEALAKWGHDDD